MQLLLETLLHDTTRAEAQHRMMSSVLEHPEASHSNICTLREQNECLIYQNSLVFFLITWFTHSDLGLPWSCWSHREWTGSFTCMQNRHREWLEQFGRAEMLRGLRKFLGRDKSEGHSIDHLKKRRARRGSGQCSALKTNMSNVLRADLEPVWDEEKHVWSFLSTVVPSGA